MTGKRPRINLRGIDWGTVSVVLILNGLGLATLYGVTVDAPEWMQQLVLRQFVWSVLGICALFIFASISHRRIMRGAPFFYVIGIFLVVLPMLLGMQRKGAHSWLIFGGLSIQPVEFAKLAFIIALARFLGARADQSRLRVPDIIITAVLSLIPAILVAKQPDFGSAIIFIAIAIVLLFLAGLSRGWIIVLTLFMVLAAVLVYPHLKPYQKDRIKVFLHPWEDSLNKGYNVVQSEIAIGSGQVWGKGFGKGSQTKYRFLPEYYTDFMFPGLVEQGGLIGGCVVLALYGILIHRLRTIALRCREAEGFYLVGGVLALFITHIILNIGMTMGLLPVTGLPLPWLSYGGSSLLMSYLAVGLALSTIRDRYIFFYGLKSVI